MLATPDAQYPDMLRMRAPRGLVAALAVAARRRQQTVSEFARQAILAKLETAGIQLHGDGHIEIRAEE